MLDVNKVVGRICQSLLIPVPVRRELLRDRCHPASTPDPGANILTPMSTHNKLRVIRVVSGGFSERRSEMDVRLNRLTYVKLPAHGAGLPGKEAVCFYHCALYPRLQGGACGFKLPVKTGGES